MKGTVCFLAKVLFLGILGPMMIWIEAYILIGASGLAIAAVVLGTLEYLGIIHDGSNTIKTLSPVLVMVSATAALFPALYIPYKAWQEEFCPKPNEQTVTPPGVAGQKNGERQ